MVFYTYLYNFFGGKFYLRRQVYLLFESFQIKNYEQPVRGIIYVALKKLNCSRVNTFMANIFGIF